MVPKFSLFSVIKNKKILLLSLVLILGIFLRFYKISDLPYPLNGDEKAFGYYAWSISHFGSDEYGNKLPFYFPSIGDYKYPVYTYLSAPLSYIFGLNPILPRLISSIASILLIITVYKFSFLLFKSSKIALISAILVTISPWNITFSRTASEANLMTFLSFLGFYFFYKFLVNKKNETKLLFYSGILFLISFFTYSASRVFIPIMILFLLLFLIFTKNYQKIKPTLLFFVFTVILVLLSFISPSSRVRANNLSILPNFQTRYEWINQSTYTLGLGNPTNPLITRLFFNKATAFFKEFTNRYISHFSFNYLFLTGDIVKLNSIPNFGNFYVFEIIFFILGISTLVNKIFKKDLASFLIFSGIVISPIAASTTIETPSAVRQLVGLPYLILAISLGLNFLLKKSKLSLMVIILFYVYFFLFLLLSVFKIKPYAQPWTTDQGNQELVKIIWSLKDNYKYIFVPNDPYIDFLFYNKITPKDFLSNAKIEEEKTGKWNRVSQLQNIIFNVDSNCPKTGQKNALYVCTGEEISPFAHIVDVINYSDNIPHYVLIDFPGGDQTQQIAPAQIKYILPKDMDQRWPSGIFTNPNQYYLNLIL